MECLCELLEVLMNKSKNYKFSPSVNSTSVYLYIEQFKKLR